MPLEITKSVNAEYLRYIERTGALIRDTLDEMQCQPIFFVDLVSQGGIMDLLVGSNCLRQFRSKSDSQRMSSVI
jgi:hypothetical protein